MTYRRRIRLEASATVEDPHVPSVTGVYPTADWQERETYDMFGIVFDGHPALTRILMPDDWDGHPQRKDYPLGGIPVQYKGATIPPPDERRSYREQERGIMPLTDQTRVLAGDRGPLSAAAVRVAADAAPGAVGGRLRLARGGPRSAPRSSG